MPRPRSRRRRRSSSGGVGLVCALAGAALVAVMGVTVMDKKAPAPRPAPPAVAVQPAPAPEPVAAPAPRVLTAMQQAERSIREVEREMPTLRREHRGEGFETLRVSLLSRAAQARDDVGAYLDRHPSDRKANRLWDRVLRAYVALKKL